MSIRFIAPAAALAVLFVCSAAQAAPVTVQFRVEGSAGTLFEGPVTTDGHAIDKGDGPHPCDGTNGNANPVPGPTMTSALDDASRSTGFPWTGTWSPSFSDFLVDSIGPDAADNVNFRYWGYALNFVPSQIGGCQQQVGNGDEVLFGYDFFSKTHLLRLAGPPRAAVGQAVQLAVTDGQTGAPLDGAAVGGALSDAAGHASVTVTGPGLVSLKAERADSLRSNAVKICVSETGAGDCGVPPSQLGGAPSGAVKDSVAPRARIKGPGDGRRYKRGPRLLSGTASDDRGVTQVKLALRRHVHAKPCRWWSSSSERFAGRGCARKVFFSIGAGTNWSYLLPRRLGPGRYVLDVKAFDRARNREERFVRGVNRVVFYVGRRYAPSASAAKRRSGARVRVLLAGRSKSFYAVARARTTSVGVGRRRCKVGASTPLAALAPVLRRERLDYRIHDYGSCSARTARGSGQLFVQSIGADRNRGNDGWFYKVNDRAPEIGAADLASRVRSGDRLLWFYCLFDDAARSCQRSLRLVRLGGAPPGAVRVQVRGYDNAGRWKPVTDATVAAGSATARTAADGAATIALPAGVHAVTARKSGLVDAFPLKV